MSSATITGHFYEIEVSWKETDRIIYIPSKKLVISSKGGVTRVGAPPTSLKVSRAAERFMAQCLNKNEIPNDTKIEKVEKKAYSKACQYIELPLDSVERLERLYQEPNTEKIRQIALELFQKSQL